MARDIQSALLAAYNLEVDYRIISIAQLTGDPTGDGCAPQEGSANRLRYKGSSFSTEDGHYTVRVTLSQNGRDFSGTAACRDSAAQRMRAISDATISAVHDYLGNNDVYTLVAVQVVEIASFPVILCMLEYMGDQGGCALIGAAKSVMNEALGVVKATLDALNRTIGRFTVGEGNT